MTRVVTRVDRAILAWISETPDPAVTLSRIEGRFLNMRGRIGYVLSASAICDYTGAAEGLTHLNVTPGGTLTGKLSDDECRPAIDWDNGTLSIWKGEDVLPQIVVAQIEGRRIGDVVEHRWLPAEGLIVGTSSTDAWLRMQCEGFSVPIEEARATLAVIADTD